MKPIRSILILVLLLSLFQIANTQEKYSSVKIYPPADKVKKAELIGLLQIDHFYEEDGAIISEISAGDIARLRSTNYRYEILVDDVAKDLEEKNRKFYAERTAGRVAIEQSNNTVGNIIATPSSFVVQPTFGGYYSFAQMEAAMDALVATYPTIVQKISLGLSIESRNIWCIKISDNVAMDEAAEPDVYFQGLQHAREAITGASMIFFMQYLAEQYAVNPKITQLVNNREFYIVPCMNPDGWEYNRLNGGVGTGQRKNRRNVGVDNPGAGDQKGVDLNRNWGIDWANCSAPIQGPVSSCGSNNPDDGTYWGTSAFSEPETQAIRNLVISKNFVVAMDQHAFGPYYSLPFGRRSLHSMSAPDQQFYTNVPALMGQYNGMRANDSYGALGYEVAGGFKDWMLLGEIGTGSKGKVYGMTGEGGAGGGTSGNNFWAPASEIVNLCKGMTYQNLQLAFSAGSYVDIQDASDIALSAVTGNLSFRITRVGLADAPVTVSLMPMENISAAGPSVTINSLPNYNDSYTGSISYALPAALTNGQRVKFAWRVQTAGYTYYDTVIKFYNPQELLYDNMEGSFSTNWVTTFVGTGASGWVFTSAGTGYNGVGRAMSESPAGTDYTNSTTRRANYNSTLNLTSATASYLSFWVRHRAENFRDKLRVEVSTTSTNGINGTWTALAGSTTVKEPGVLDGSTINGIPSLTGIRENWTRELFDLSAYNGTAALQLRFIFTSNGAASFSDALDDGFYIDEVKVIKSTAAMITLPVQFKSFSGRLLADETIRLDWQAETDNQHDYFEVEKSSTGTSFTSIGRGPSLAPYWHIDPLPYIGNNFYRIKQVDKDGTITYSHIVTVNYNPEKFNVSVYPNPVTDILNIKINAAVPDQYIISIADLAGRKVHEEKIGAGQTGREINIDLRQKAAQLYILTIRNSKNEIVSTQKVIKK